MQKFLKVLLDARLQLFFFALLALCLHAFVWLFMPQDGPVILYKLGLPVVAAIIGLFFDFAAFPYARPDSYLVDYWKNNPNADNPGDADYPIAEGYTLAFNTACIRRALVIAAFVLAMSLGL